MLAAVVGAGGSGCLPKNIDWTTPRAFPLISFAIACLSSSNNRSKFSLFAAIYACSSLYNACASARLISRYVGGMGDLDCEEGRWFNQFPSENFSRHSERTEVEPPNMLLSVNPDSDNRFAPPCCQASTCRFLASASCLAYSTGISFPWKAFRIGRTSGGR